MTAAAPTPQPDVRPPTTWSEPALWWAGAVGLRLLLGPIVEPLVAAVPLVLVVVRRPRVGRVAWVMLGLGCWAALQILLPRGALPAPLAPPTWAPPAVRAGAWSLSLAPWETIDWVVRFGGAALWALVLGGDAWARRRQGTALRWLAGGAAAAVILAAVSDWALPWSANHAAIFLVAALAEPLLRWRTGKVAAVAAAGAILVAAAVLRAWAPLVLALAVAGWTLGRWRRPAPRWWGWPAGLVALAAAAGAVVADALLLDTGISRGLVVRAQFWRDMPALLADALPGGLGFGAFRWVVLPYAEHLPLPAVRAWHPENGLLWLLIEGGLPAALLVAGLLVGARRQRSVAATAARTGVLVLVVHSLIDVAWLWGPVWWLWPLLLRCGWQWAGRFGDHGMKERERAQP